MPKILVIDDDPDVRALHRMRLSETFEIIETGEPEQALSLALEHKPVAILLDLMMPKCSGFELCQSLHSLSYTSMIPIFIITGESAEKYKAHCETLGARAFFEKPVDYKQLKARLNAELQTTQPDRRSNVRVRMRVLYAAGDGIHPHESDARGHQDLLDDSIEHDPRHYVTMVGSIAIFVLMANAISIVPAFRISDRASQRSAGLRDSHVYFV